MAGPPSSHGAVMEQSRRSHRTEQSQDIVSPTFWWYSSIQYMDAHHTFIFTTWDCVSALNPIDPPYYPLKQGNISVPCTGNNMIWCMPQMLVADAVYVSKINSMICRNKWTKPNWRLSPLSGYIYRSSWQYTSRCIERPERRRRACPLSCPSILSAHNATQSLV